MNITFITGTGRCGSNILCRLFSKHPDVATLPFETRYMIDPDGIIDFMHSFQCWSPYMAGVKIRRLQKFLFTLFRKPTDKYNEWELEEHIPDYSSIVQKLINSLTQFTYPCKWPGMDMNAWTASHGDTVNYSSYIDRSESIKDYLRIFLIDTFKAICGDKKYYVDDNTWTCLFAKEIHELLPEAKFIYLYREPKDVIADFIQQRWLPKDFKQATVIYKDLIMKWEETKFNLPDYTYEEVAFEHMVREKEKCINFLCKFTGIPFHESLMETELKPEFIGFHKKVFTADQIEWLNNELKNEMLVMKYL